METESPQKTGSPLWIDLGWLALCLIISTAWCWTSAREIGVTFDEPIYLQTGLDHWRTGSSTELMKLGTMPLPVDVVTMPLYLYETSRGVPIDLQTETMTVLPWARMMTACFWWLLLVFAWLIARSLGGPWAGRLAVGLLAFEPTFLAHASLATTDIAVTAMLLPFAYYFYRNRGEKWGWRVALPGVLFGLAILTKASGLVFGGICMLVIDWLWRKAQREQNSAADQPAPTFRSSYRDMVHIGLIGMTITFVYCGSDFQPQTSFYNWAHELPDSIFASIMVFLSENLCIFSNAGEGIIRQVRHNMRGHGVYLLEVYQKRALWWYFPVALSIKLAVPLLLAPVLLIALKLSKRSRHFVRDNWALLCGLVLLVFTLTCRVQIGVRLVLPVVAILVVGVSAALVVSTGELRARWSRQLVAGLMVAGVMWMSFTAVRIWPDGLTYVNQAWAGTNEDYKMVSDANFDWGQGIGDLQEWESEHPDVKLGYWYYGTDPRISLLKAEHVQMHQLPVETPEDFHAHLQGRYLAVATSLAYGSLSDPSVIRAREFLRTQQPVERTKTFLIYDFTEPRVAQVNDESLPLKR